MSSSEPSWGLHIASIPQTKPALETEHPNPNGTGRLPMGRNRGFMLIPQVNLTG